MANIYTNAIAVLNVDLEARITGISQSLRSTGGGLAEKEKQEYQALQQAWQTRRAIQDLTKNGNREG